MMNNAWYIVLALLGTFFLAIFFAMLVPALDVAKVVNHLHNSCLENVSTTICQFGNDYCVGCRFER